jgi:hypothetical protein
MDPDLTSENTTAEPAPERQRIYERVPWRRVFTVALVLLFWVVIGLVCSPTDFRF